MKLMYGTDECKKDITNIVLSTCLFSNKIIIPDNDNIRELLFDDNNLAKNKYVELNDDFGNSSKFYQHQFIKIDINENLCLHDEINYKDFLKNIHNTLILKYGSFDEEYPEQLMTVKFLTSDMKVVELGGNIGRNSLIISSMLSDSKNHVVLECNELIASQLKENRDLNKLNFHIETCALSKRKLYLLCDKENNPSWLTCDDISKRKKFKKISTISYQNLKNKYNLEFDVLIADCEGGLYYILVDDEHILNDFRMIILENDFIHDEHKNFVDNCFLNHNFIRIYKESHPYKSKIDNFYEVWIKKNSSK